MGSFRRLIARINGFHVKKGSAERKKASVCGRWGRRGGATFMIMIRCRQPAQLLLGAKGSRRSNQGEPLLPECLQKGGRRRRQNVLR